MGLVRAHQSQIGFNWFQLVSTKKNKKLILSDYVFKDTQLSQVLVRACEQELSGNTL